MTTQPHALCPAAALKDGEAQSFIVDVSGARHDILVLRHNRAFHAYVNACPHQQTPLETFPGNFFDAAGKLLVCSTHGARFEPASGQCIAGPCIGKSLKPIALIMRDGALYARI